ncbi:hypothetical protein GTQ40_09655 [Flavobacteriaceae bacterium R38]|nr:hypothetical protein [Flavobacteriaceae bacterium R38]
MYDNEVIKEKSWFKRNWKWVVPAGGCLTLILVFIFGIGALFFGVSKMFTGSQPYQYAMERISENEYLIDQLGEPIETNGIMNGNITLNNRSGSADFSIPIKGPKGAADLFIVGEKSAGEWTYSKLHVIIDETNEKVNLLE